MLLNMWMVTNCLTSLEPELYLNNNEELDIKGVRLYSMESGYIYVYENKKDCICSYKSEYFILPMIKLEIAFGILQEVFEFYEELENNLINLVKMRRFQQIVDSCYTVLKNPLVILDDNYKVMGLSTQFSGDEVDEEWKYLSENGYSSIKAVRELQQRNVVAKYGVNEERNTVKRVKLELFSYVNVCKFVKYNSIICGRIIVIEKERAVNLGDIYFMQKIADIVAPYIQISDASDISYTGNSVFNLLLDEKILDEGVLEMQLKYFDWNENDRFYLFMIDFIGEEKNQIALQLMRIALLKHVKECHTLVHHGRIIVIGNVKKCKESDLIDKIENIIIRNDAECIVSLEVDNIHKISFLYRQLEKYYNKTKMLSKNIYYFRDYAIEYILSCDNLQDKIHACYPEIRRYYENYQDMQYMEVVKAYLLNHESLVDTAKKLFTHRNTVVYRLNKAKELMNLEFDNGESCLYYIISIKILEIEYN